MNVKDEVLKMMTKNTSVALVAAISCAALSFSAVAQDDLDALLLSLDAEAKAAEEASAETPAVTETPAPSAEEPAAEEETPTEEPATEEPAAEEEATTEPEATIEPAEEKPAVEEPKDEEPTEEPAPKKETPAPKVAPTPAPVAPAAKPVSPDAELLSNITATERVRRQAMDEQAKRLIIEARKSMKAKQYEESVRYYTNALKLLNDRVSSNPFRRECEHGIAEGFYRQAIQYWDIGRHQAALDIMMKARDHRHPRAQGQIEKWQVESLSLESEETQGESETLHAMNEEDYKAKRDLVRRHLRRARQYLALREMDKAVEECDVVLASDPYNEEAMRIREAIGKKRQFIRSRERESAREMMIADVDQAWRPAYSVNAAQLAATSAETVKTQTGEDPERTQEQEILKRMKEMRLPNISFKPPATIVDAVEEFRRLSRDYDRPDIPAEKRGFNFVLRTPPGAIKIQPEEETSDDFSASASSGEATPSNGLDPIQTIMASDITFYEAMKLVCDSVRYKFIVSGQVVMVMPQDMSTAELIARKYNVPEAFVERVDSASEELKSMGGGFGSSSRRSSSSSSSDEEGEGQNWKAFFEEMGVSWPEGSSIKHIKSLGKLYVRNTRENLAEFEKVLDELGGQPQLIEIETRFVEVSQEDLNSLGFEWILNSDYSLRLDNKLSQLLHLNGSKYYNKYVADASSSSSSSSYDNKGNSHTQVDTGGSSSSIGSGSKLPNIGVNAIGGVSDFSQTTADDGTRTYSTGGRYLSTTGNHISGSGSAYNDQFMRVNAFLGQADLSMILHMLAQRSDTDLLSAPKIVTKSGENAVIKIVTEYIYPQDYDVQLQTSSSSGYSSGSQSAVLAIVEPQNFTMREVGVILDVTPTYSEANGGTIDLELKPQVVDEPTWKNYGMRIPFSGNANVGDLSLGELVPPFGNAEPADTALKESIIAQYWNAVAQMYSTILGGGNNNNITYYEAPMEQPFFHVRSIDSKVSITPGATVVMGGLITEQRKAMDDKVPFLGDLPFIGRLFRSHAEQTIKRNLLIFVTGRLITPAGRELKLNEPTTTSGGDVKPAPTAN